MKNKLFLLNSGVLNTMSGGSHMAKSSRCPYHVKQGLLDAEGNFELKDICGVKAACGMGCPLAPFQETSHSTCATFLSLSQGTGKQILMPKDIEFLPEVNGSVNFSELDLM